MKGLVLKKLQGMDQFTLYRLVRGPAPGIPIYATRVCAGFPSPADDYLEQKLDLNQLLIKHPSATFFVRVEGHSMEGAGIFSGDILIVDRALTPKQNDIIVCVLNGEFSVKRFRKQGGLIVLHAEHPDYPPLSVTAEMDFQVWGVVPYVIHKT